MLIASCHVELVLDDVGWPRLIIGIFFISGLNQKPFNATKTMAKVSIRLDSLAKMQEQLTLSRATILGLGCHCGMSLFETKNKNTVLVNGPPRRLRRQRGLHTPFITANCNRGGSGAANANTATKQTRNWKVPQKREQLSQIVGTTVSINKGEIGVGQGHTALL